MYSVKFLNDEEFNLLPAKDVEDVMGVAYPHTGEAFVRQSGSSTMDVFTALHELEHLKGNDLDEHFDADNKCYYKKSSSFFKAIIPMVASMIPGIGPIAGPASAAYIGARDSRKAQEGAAQGIADQENSMFSGPGMPDGPMAPNVIQAPGSGGGSGIGEASGSATGGVKGLQEAMADRNTPYNPMDVFGTYSGRL